MRPCIRSLLICCVGHVAGQDLFGGLFAPPPAKNGALTSAEMYKCEVCMTVMQRHEVGAKEESLCAGLEYYGPVCQNIKAAMLRYEKWMKQWLFGNGCLKVTPIGLASTKPCPPHVVCSWMVCPSDGADKEPFCPPDGTYKSAPMHKAAAGNGNGVVEATAMERKIPQFSHWGLVFLQGPISFVPHQPQQQQVALDQPQHQVDHAGMKRNSKQRWMPWNPVMKIS